MEPENILGIFQLISDINIVNGELEVQLRGWDYPSTTADFSRDSFMRDLFELIKHHLLEDNDG